MKPTIENVKRRAAPTLRAAGVSRAALFGSVVHGQWKRGSDIDLLIEFSGRRSLLDLVGLERRLKESLGVDVDLVTYRSVHPLLRDRILGEQIPILP